MAYKIFIENNYFTIIDPAPSTHTRNFPAEFVRYQRTGNTFRFYFDPWQQHLILNSNLIFTDIIDGNDQPFATADDFEAWLKKNTGGAAGINYFNEVADGNIPGDTPFGFDGISSAVPLTVATIWPLNIPYIFPTSASIMTVSSESANDTLLGTGARIVTVEGLDINRDRISEDVETDGQAAVPTVNSYFRINNIFVKKGQTGILGHNDDNIYIGTGTVTAGVPANIFGFMAQNTSLSQSAVISVPRNHIYKIWDVLYNVDAARSARLFFTSIDQGTKATIITATISEALEPQPRVVPIVINGGTDFIISGQSTSSGAQTAEVSIFISGILTKVS